MKKYIITAETVQIGARTLHRIKALRDIKKGRFIIARKGELGGYIESESNLSQDGEAWVSGDAAVYGNAKVYGNARVCEEAEIYGDALVYDEAEVYGDALVYGDTRVYGNAFVCDEAYQTGDIEK